MPTGWIKVSTIALIALVLEGGLALAAAGLLSLKTPQAGDALWQCNAGPGEFSCSFTNTSAVAIAGRCMRGKLIPRGKGKAMDATPLCSGTVGPRETKVVSVRLVGQEVLDACHDANAGLDFSQCELKVEEIP